MQCLRATASECEAGDKCDRSERHTLAPGALTTPRKSPFIEWSKSHPHPPLKVITSDILRTKFMKAWPAVRENRKRANATCGWPYRFIQLLFVLHPCTSSFVLRPSSSCSRLLPGSVTGSQCGAGSVSKVSWSLVAPLSLCLCHMSQVWPRRA